MMMIEGVEIFEDLSYYHAITVVYSIICVLAFSLNSFVLIIFQSNKMFPVSSNALLISMALSDWLMATIATPVGAYANSQHWWTLNSSTCQYYAFVSTLFGLTSMVHLTALSFERWIAVKRPMAQEISKKKMALVVVGLWMFSLAWSTFPLLGWSSYGPEPGFTCCSITWYSNVPSSVAYVTSLFVFFFFLPCFIMVFCYLNIYREVRKITAKAKTRWGALAVSTRRTVRGKWKTAKVSIIMVLAFFVAWTPYALVAMYTSWTGNRIPLLFTTLPAMFAKLSSCYNPLIYFFMYQKFRKASKRLVANLFSVPLSTHIELGRRRSTSRRPRQSSTV